MKQKVKYVEQPETRRQSLWIALITVVVVYALWNVSQFNFIMYPLRLFVTYVHEAGHALAALATGGYVAEFSVFANGGGVAMTGGGSRFFILPAGYLGAAFFGSMLFYLANRYPQHTQKISSILGLFLVVFSFLYARGSGFGNTIILFVTVGLGIFLVAYGLFSDEEDVPAKTRFGAIAVGLGLFLVSYLMFNADVSRFNLALLIGVSFGLVLIVLGWFGSQRLNTIILDILGLVSALNAVLYIWIVVQYSDASLGEIKNDAAAFASEYLPIVPPVVIAIVWAGLSVLMLGIAVWFSVLKPLGQELIEE